jgi:hypothetical protein
MSRIQVGETQRRSIQRMKREKVCHSDQFRAGILIYFILACKQCEKLVAMRCQSAASLVQAVLRQENPVHKYQS